MLLGLGGRVENVLHADALAVRAEVNLENALTNPPVGDDVSRVVESLEIGGCTQMSCDSHRADTERRGIEGGRGGWLHLRGFKGQWL